MKKRICAALLVLVLLLVCIPRPAEAASISYYGREALEELDNGKALVKAYDLIVKGVEAMTGEIIIRQADITVAEMEIVLDAYRRDHSEQFWFNSCDSYRPAGQKVYSIFPVYTIEETELETAQAAMEARIADILSGLEDSMSDYEKELYLHDTLAKQVVYQDGANAHNAYGALVEGAAVCDGYAEALQVLLHRAGLRSFIALGSDRNTGVAHAWNYVYINGSWHHTDLTWNDQDERIYHAYFNMSEAMITEDHILDSCSFTLPVCTSADAHYYTVNGNCFSAETYTVAGIAALMQKTPWTATVYITDDTDSFWQWIQNNIYGILSATGATDIVSYGYYQMGREMVVYLRCNHTNLTNHAPATGTCLKPGNSGYYSCDACGALFGTDQTTVLEEIPYLYSDHIIVEGYCIVCQVYSAGEHFYATFEEAAAAGSDYIRLNVDCEQDISLEASAYLDLNGKTLSGNVTVSDGATLYLFDTATAGYDATHRGRITGQVSGQIAPNCNTPAGYGYDYKYLTLVEQDGTISAHRYFMTIRAAYLHPYQQDADYYGSAVNYRTVFRCSDFLANYVTEWGTKLTGDQCVYAEASSLKAGVNSSKTALVGTIRDNNSEEQNLQNSQKQVLAQGYIRLQDGTELVSAGVTRSLEDMAKEVSYMSLTDRQKLAMQQMCRMFPELMTLWGIDIERFQ